MASLRKRDKTWYIRFRDASGKQCERKCGPDKSVANGIKRDLENRLVNIKLGESSGHTRVPRVPRVPGTPYLILDRAEFRGHGVPGTPYLILDRARVPGTPYLILDPTGSRAHRLGKAVSSGDR